MVIHIIQLSYRLSVYPDLKYLVTRVFLILFPDPFPYLIWEQGRAGREARVKNSNVQAESHGVQKAYKSRLGVLRTTNYDEGQWQT